MAQTVFTRFPPTYNGMYRTFVPSWVARPFDDCLALSAIARTSLHSFTLYSRCFATHLPGYHLNGSDISCRPSWFALDNFYIVLQHQFDIHYAQLIRDVYLPLGPNRSGDFHGLRLQRLDQ